MLFVKQIGKVRLDIGEEEIDSRDKPSKRKECHKEIFKEVSRDKP